MPRDWDLSCVFPSGTRLYFPGAYSSVIMLFRLVSSWDVFNHRYCFSLAVLV